MRRRLAAAATLAALALSAGPLAAQGPRPPFLYLNQERVLTGSERGRALLAEEEAARDGLRAEARRIESAFEAEERQLTDQRATLDPAEFRALQRFRRPRGQGPRRPGRPRRRPRAGV